MFAHVTFIVGAQLTGQGVLPQHSKMPDIGLFHADCLLGEREKRCLQHAARGAGRPTTTRD